MPDSSKSPIPEESGKLGNSSYSYNRLYDRARDARTTDTNFRNKHHAKMIIEQGKLR